MMTEGSLGWFGEVPDLKKGPQGGFGRSLERFLDAFCEPKVVPNQIKSDKKIRLFFDPGTNRFLRGLGSAKS